MVNINKGKRVVNYRKKSPSINASFLGSVDINCFNEVETLDDAQSATDKFYKIANDLLNNYYPVKTITLTNKDPDFITPEIKAMLRKKNRIMRKGRIEEAEAIAVKIGHLIARYNSNKLRSLEKKDSQSFWREVNKITNKQAGSRDNKNTTGLTSNDLNNHYADTSTDLKYSAPRKKLTCNNHDHKLLKEYDVFKILDTLANSASGPDDPPVWFLRLIAPFASGALTHVYNLSLSTGTVPTQWKRSIITPVAKIKEPVTPADYRPISVTSILARRLEQHVVKKYLYPAMLKPPPELIFEDQYAFRPTGSATAALIATINKVTELIRSGYSVVLISLDFSKAFDRVRHKTLFEKYELLDIDDFAYNWIVSYFEDRSHSTKFFGEVSSMRRVNASVVQGSGIGPASYSIAESDLKPRNSVFSMFKFADDVDLITILDHHDQIPAEMEHIGEWAEKNNLILNKTKTKEIIFNKGCRVWAPSTPHCGN